MQIIKQNVGVEVDSQKLQLCFMTVDIQQQTQILGQRKFNNTLAGFKQMATWIENKRIQNLPVHLTMEATGVYSENVSYFFCDKSEYIVHVVLPNMVKAFFKSHNQKSKNDMIDAIGLARMGSERLLTQWKPNSPQMRRIKKLSRARLQLIKAKTVATNQLHAEQASYKPEKTLVKMMKSQIAFLEKQIKKYECAIQREVEKDQKLKAQIDNICQAPGIGFITARGVMAELDSFSLFTKRSQVVSFCGYDVIQKESGTSVRGVERISKKGNSRVRRLLYMAAMSAVRFDDHHKAYYTRIVKKTGIKMKANVAIQRKLLLLIFALSDASNQFDPQHPHRMQKELNQRQEANETKKLEAATMQA